jgi:lysozyme
VKGKLVVAGLLVVAGAIALGVVRQRAHAPGDRPPLPGGCQLGPTTAGIDVSYYQRDIDWTRVRRAGIEFAFIRVGDGAELFDPRFVANWEGARRARVLRGAYQFFRPEQSPIDQANVVVRALTRHGAGELPPVLDLEVTGGLPLATVTARAKQWVDHVRAKLGVEPIVYTNPGMWRQRAGGAAELGAQRLWVAHYTQLCPAVPAPWAGWAFWQYTDDGRIDGIDGPVDLNVFAGTPADLQRVRAQAAAGVAAGASSSR